MSQAQSASVSCSGPVWLVGPHRPLTRQEYCEQQAELQILGFYAKMTMFSHSPEAVAPCDSVMTDGGSTVSFSQLWDHRPAIMFHVIQ